MKNHALSGRLARGAAMAAVMYTMAAYFLIPLAWKRYEGRHPGLDAAPRVARTSSGIPGDPINIALVASETDLAGAMVAAGWQPADPITLKSCLKIAVGTVFHRPYLRAPVSSLYLWGRKEDLAFEQAAGGDPRRRHHVRFWQSAALDDGGQPLWLGAATFDRSVGLSRTTAQITHHIGPDVDAERDKLAADLEKAGWVKQVDWIDGFHSDRSGRNGGGDTYYTDGRLAVALLRRTSPAGRLPTAP